MVDTERKTFGIYVRISLSNKFFSDFSWNFSVLSGVLKKSSLERYIQLPFMRVTKES